MQTQQDSNKTFHIYSENGQKKQGLKLAFIKIKMLAPWDTSVLSPDGSLFPIVYEQEVVDAFKTDDKEIKCIISFQVYEDGEAYAVARLHHSYKHTIAKGN